MHPIIEKFRKAEQGHVFAHFDKLDGPAKDALIAEAEEIDLGELALLNRTLLGQSAAVDLADLSPAPYEKLPENGGDRETWGQAKLAGVTALRAGRVAAFTVAGGQGTRLGYDGPKGTFRITPVHKRPLFQVFAEKIIAVGRRYGWPLHWFIMTSHQNHESTKQFFADHENFGMEEWQIHFFRQGRMPAVDFDGKIILDTPGSIAMSPDGHGGSLRALARSGALDLMEREGIDILSYFQVDNPLVRCIDPTFIGWHILRNSEMSSKMVPKAYAGEMVGHFCQQRDRLVVVEYSDLPNALQEETDAEGRLRFDAGSIAIHLLDRDFIRRMAESAPGESALAFHRANKKIPTIDATGQVVTPTKANGVKFELFVFDALPFARNPVVIETERGDDFSPVKNAEGNDSPQTCRDDQRRQFARWLKSVGADVLCDESGLPEVNIEVSPLFGYDCESFTEAWLKLSPKPKVVDRLYLDA